MLWLTVSGLSLNFIGSFILIFTNTVLIETIQSTERANEIADNINADSPYNKIQVIGKSKRLEPIKKRNNSIIRIAAIFLSVGFAAQLIGLLIGV